MGDSGNLAISSAPHPSALSAPIRLTPPPYRGRALNKGFDPQGPSPLCFVRMPIERERARTSDRFRPTGTCRALHRWSGKPQSVEILRVERGMMNARLGPSSRQRTRIGEPSFSFVQRPCRVRPSPLTLAIAWSTVRRNGAHPHDRCPCRCCSPTGPIGRRSASAMTPRKASRSVRSSSRSAASGSSSDRPSSTPTAAEIPKRTWRGYWKDRIWIAFCVLLVLFVATYLIDLQLGSSVYATCTVIKKDRSGGGKSKVEWTLDVKCPASRERAITSRNDWDRRKRGDHVQIEIRTSWLFGFRRVTTR